MGKKRHCVCVPLTEQHYIHTFDDLVQTVDMTCEKLKLIIDQRKLEPDRKTRKLGVRIEITTNTLTVHTFDPI